MDVLFLQVGGTIDKGYPAGADDHGYAFKIGEPAFLSVIARVELSFNWSHEVVMRKDSLDMTDEDRELICSCIEDSREEGVIITHGTDTIHKTASMLSSISGKTIVLTGAMLPEKFRDSDADFNLGMAVAAVQCLPNGVYIALYGEVVPWDKFKPR
jgi:L-asparaginase